MNAITQRSAGAVASLSNLKAGLQNVASTIVATGGDPFLRLLTDGTWVYGADNVEVEDGSLWAINPFSVKHGWVSWTDKPGKQANEIVGEVMVPAGSPLPPQGELQDTGWPWAQQLSFQLKCMTGEDTGTQVLYKTSSVGGMNAVKTFIGKLTTHLDADPETPVAVVTLDQDHYQHKKFGKTYTPIFEVEKWISLDDAPAEDEPTASTKAEPEAKPAPAPARARRTAAEQQTDQPAPETSTAAVSAADRKAAILAELARMEAEGASEAPDESAEPEQEAAPAPRRRRR